MQTGNNGQMWLYITNGSAARLCVGWAALRYLSWEEPLDRLSGRLDQDADPTTQPGTAYMRKTPLVFLPTPLLSV